jgi:hypothetical protein
MSKKTKQTEDFIESPVKKTIVKTIKEQPKKPSWEIKDRTYYLLGKSPLTFTVASKHTGRNPMLWFDINTGEQRELRYATNQNSPFVDEQKGQVTLGHIIFRDGSLFVPKEKQNLQKLLSLYHPERNIVYSEFDAEIVAKDELSDLELEIDALNLAKEIDVDMAEAIMRVEIGSEVNSMSSKELKRDLLLFARKNPRLFMNLASDENVHLRNIAVVAAESGIIKLSQDQRTFTWASNGRKLMNVPFDENPYSAMASYFKTDEGTEVYKSIEKRLK